MQNYHTWRLTEKCLHIAYDLKLLYIAFEELEMGNEQSRDPWTYKGFKTKKEVDFRKKSFLKYVSEAFRDFFKEHVVQGNYFEPIGLDKPTERNLQSR